MRDTMAPYAANMGVCTAADEESVKLKRHSQG